MNRNEAASVIQRFLTCRDIRTDDCCGHCETCRYNTEYDEKTEALQLAIKALEQAPAIPISYINSRISRLRQYKTYAGDFGADFLEAIIKDYNKEKHNDKTE